MNNDTLLFIVEGTNREINIFKCVDREFFSKPKVAITISIPADMNIYMLYAILKEDGFYTDIIEILRERDERIKEKLEGYSRNSFSGIYLFFDFDEQANNLGLESREFYLKAIVEMVQHFNDPSEEGKLYISYPMVEAFRDWKKGSCQTNSEHCLVSRDDFEDYKKNSAGSRRDNISKYTYADYCDAFNAFVTRVCCLMGIRRVDRVPFLMAMSQENVLSRQIELYEKSDSVFILSAIPAFLLEYSERNWNTTIKKRHAVCFPLECSQKPL